MTYYAKPILDLIGKYESRGDYNVIWGGISRTDYPKKPLTEMTIAEVLAWQDSIDSRYRSEAAGKYQILEDTLRGLVSKYRIDTSRLFNKSMQDDLAMKLLAGRGFNRFLGGQNTADDMMLGLAKEWASFPVPRFMRGASRHVDAGQSYYAGDGLNKAHATIAEVEQALNLTLERYLGETRPVPKPETPVKSDITPAAKSGGLIAALMAVLAKILGGKA